MKPKVLLAIIPLLIFLIGPAPQTFAESTKTCHCFKNRVYNPADRFAADDYILATSFNSLISKAYNIPKKQIVFLKMKGGAAHMDLIVALRAAKVAKTDLQRFLDLRKQKLTWGQILFSPEFSNKIQHDKLLFTLQSGSPVEEIGPQIADSLIADFYKIPLDVVELLRSSGLDEKEMALVFILAHAKNKNPSELAAQHEKHGKSWSQIANSLDIEPAQAGKLIIKF